MTGPNGESSAGYWEFLTVEPRRMFEVRDGFSCPDGSPNTEMPATRLEFLFEETSTGSRLTTTTYFASLDDLERLVKMGMMDGMRSAMAQIDDVVSDLASFAAGKATEIEILSDTQVRASRVIRGTPEQVWRAHHDVDLLRRWLLGPPGWTMPVCEVATSPGETFRYEWEDQNGEGRFGITGELRESRAPYRSVTTEKMTDTQGPSTLNELTLTPVDDGTLLSIVITYADADMRDAVLATGMVDGMEGSYARLENEVLATA